MYGKHVGGECDEEKKREEAGSDTEGWSVDRVEGCCLMVEPLCSSMIDKVRNLLISLNIPSNSYDAILSDIDDASACLKDLLISSSSDLENTKNGSKRKTLRQRI